MAFPAASTRPADGEIDLSLVRIDADAATLADQAPVRAGRRGGATAHDVVGRQDADHRFPMQIVTRIGTRVLAGDGNADCEHGNDHRLAKMAFMSSSDK